MFPTNQWLYMTALPGDFEQLLTQGKTQWITSLSHDAAARRVAVGFTHHPEQPETERIARFSGVERVEARWQDREEGCMETLIGAHETSGGGFFRYLLVTDQREIEFAAAEKAKVYEV
jgi:hypothetical protein